MTKVLEENPLLSYFQACLRERRILYRQRYENGAFFVRLPPSFDEYLAGRTGKFRNNLKRINRRMQEAGALRVQKLADADGFDKAYDALLQIERNSWKHLHGTAISAVGLQAGFYRDMSKAALGMHRMWLQLVWLDELPIAYEMGYLGDGHYYGLKCSFDERYKALSPATFLRARLIEQLIESGIPRYDFHGEPYEWERKWTEDMRWHRSVLVYNKTFKARLIALYSKLKQMRNGGNADPRLAYCDARSLKSPGKSTVDK